MLHEEFLKKKLINIVVEIISLFTLCRKIKSKLTELYKKNPSLGGNQNI